MKANMGTTDRVIRTLITLGIVAAWMLGALPTAWALPALAVAGIMLATSLMSFCPLYLPFGLNTLVRKQKVQH